MTVVGGGGGVLQVAAVRVLASDPAEATLLRTWASDTHGVSGQTKLGPERWLWTGRADEEVLHLLLPVLHLLRVFLPPPSLPPLASPPFLLLL
jgi:hypothetical protein